MPLKLVQVGLGGWGRSWARNVVAKSAAVETVAYVEPSPAAREQLLRELDLTAARFFSSVEEALAEVLCDAVLVTTPIAGHVPIGLAALAAGKHVLIEKPLALTTAAAQPLVDAAARAGLIAMVSQNYRYFPAPLKAATLVRSRSMGCVRHIDLQFRRNLIPNAPLHYRLQQPLLVDMAIHHFDLLRMVLADEPVEIYCRTWNPIGSPYLEEPAGAAIIRFAGGTVVTYQGSWVSTGKPTFWAGEWRMECDDGDIFWSSRAGDKHGAKRDWLSLKPSGRRQEKVALHVPELTGRAASLDAFCRAVESGAPPEYATPVNDNIRSVALMEAMVASARSGEPVRTLETVTV